MKELFWGWESELMSVSVSGLTLLPLLSQAPTSSCCYPQFSWHFSLFSLWFLFVLKYITLSQSSIDTSCCYPVPQFFWHFTSFPRLTLLSFLFSLLSSPHQNWIPASPPGFHSCHILWQPCWVAIAISIATNKWREIQTQSQSPLFMCCQ